MPFALRLCVVFCTYCLVAIWPAKAQEFRDTGPVRVVLPGKDWVRTDPPEAVVKWSAANPGFKLLFYAQSTSSKLKLHVTQFDYPPLVSSAQLSEFVANLKRRYQTSAMGAVAEDSRSIAGLPAIELEARYRGWTFTSARIFFCANRAYLLEVGGSADFQSEAGQCFAGITLTGEQALANASVVNLTDLRRRAVVPPAKPPGRSNMTHILIEIGVILGAVVGALAIAMRIASILRMRAAAGGDWDDTPARY